MTDPIQSSLPGTDVPSEPARRRRGRPLGGKNPQKGTLFSDGGGDFRLYVITDDGKSLATVAEQPGFTDSGQAARWLRQHGGREDLLGQTVIVMRGIAIIKIEMAPSLLFKPRGKPPARKQSTKVEQPAEPEPVST